MFNTRENILTGLELAISKIVPAAHNKWVSVKELSIVKTLNEVGLNKNYAAPFQEVLKKEGLLFVEGECGGMHYTIKSDIIPDFKSLAEKMHACSLELQRKRRLSAEDGYPYSNSSDLRPKRNLKSNQFESLEKQGFNSKVFKRKITLPTVNDLVFIFKEGVLHQGLVTGMQRVLPQNSASEEPTKGPKSYILKYSVTIPNENSNEDSWLTVHNLLPTDIFHSVDEAAAHVVKHTKYFSKEDLKTFNL